MALLSEETDSCAKRIGDVMGRVNLLSHSAAENAAKLFMMATLKPLQAHQRKRVLEWLMREPLLRGAFG